MLGKEFIDKNETCAYFGDRPTITKYWHLEECSPTEYQGLLEHGWRRFGKLHFTPICEHCNECRSIRICVDKFKFSKSQKRVISKNKKTKIVIQQPTFDEDKLALYNKYHKKMNEKKEWKFRPIDEKNYRASYVEGYGTFGYEFLYYDDEKLIGVAFVDILSTAMSAIYCFYDHDYAHLSIGKFSILTQIRVAKHHHIPYIYMGYWMKDHYSMGYKEAYQPFEVLKDMITPVDDKTVWYRYRQ
jgi:arginine-tRNA-protein transferase